jgi:amino acid transporter
MLGICLILVLVIICSIAAHFRLNGFHGFNFGDPENIFTGAAMMYVSIILFFSWKGYDDWLLRFLNKKGQALPLALLFGLLGIVSLVVGLIPA